MSRNFDKNTDNMSDTMTKKKRVPFQSTLLSNFKKAMFGLARFRRTFFLTLFLAFALLFGFVFRFLIGLLLRALTRFFIIGNVETGAFENKAIARTDQALNFTPAFRTFSQRFCRNALKLLEFVITFTTTIFISWHTLPFLENPKCLTIRYFHSNEVIIAITFNLQKHDVARI